MFTRSALLRQIGKQNPRQPQLQRAIFPGILASQQQQQQLQQQLRFFSVINLSDESAVQKFHHVNHKSVLYFTAQWCPPCKMIKPIYEKMATEYADSVAFGKIDVDENEDAAVEFEITSVPTFVLFEGQNAIDRFSGADAERLGQIVKELAER